MEWLKFFDFLKMVWTAMNSPIGITAIAGILAWLLKRLWSIRPAWQAYEGSIIAAVKFAEKEIPDDTENKSLQRLDAALEYVLKVYANTEGRAATRKVAGELAEAIAVKHAELEASGTLSKGESIPVKHGDPNGCRTVPRGRCNIPGRGST